MNSPNYPDWLKEFFTIMSLSYNNLWTDRFYDKQFLDAGLLFWYDNLKKFDPEIIIESAKDAVKMLKFPPTPSQMEEILRANQKIKQANLEIESRGIKRLQNKNQPRSRQTVLEMIDIWKKLGNLKKLEECKDELSRMDMLQE